MCMGVSMCVGVRLGMYIMSCMSVWVGSDVRKE